LVFFGELAEGINIGNNIKQLKQGDIGVNLNTLIQISIGYATDSWGISLLFLNILHYYSFLQITSYR
jgi:hypothetical protein